MCKRIDLGNGSFAIVCGGRSMHNKKPVEVSLPATAVQLEAAGYLFKYTRPCRRCGVLLEFWLTPAKKWAPLERINSDREHRRLSHFSTCPFADEFRKLDNQMDLFGAGEK